jgi:putative resolvase
MDHSRGQLLKAREAARYLGVSLNTLYRMEQKGHLNPFRTPGGHRRYSLEMLDRYLERSRLRYNNRGSAG